MRHPNARKQPRRKRPRPDITVITPSVPGREQMLAEACASVAAQTLRPAAHLVAVDHKHLGPGPTIDRLVRASETEWLSILADDDLYDPDYLETLAAETPHADIVLAWCRLEGRDDPQHRGPFNPEDMLARKDTGMRGTFMFRRSLHQRVGGWPKGLLEDWLFLCAAHEAGARFAPVYRELWTYRFHGGNVSEIVTRLIRGEQPDELLHLRRHL